MTSNSQSGIINLAASRPVQQPVEKLEEFLRALASPGSAIDLPLKILVWEDTDGKAWVSYNCPGYLQARHSVPAELVQNIAAVENLARAAAE